MSALGFSSCPSVDTLGCYKYNNVALGFGPRDETAHLAVFLHFIMHIEQEKIECLCLNQCLSSCDLLVSKQHICHIGLFEKMEAAGLGLRKSGKFKAIRVGLPILVKTQSMSPRVLLMCWFPSKVSIHLRAVSDFLNRICKLALRRSQPLIWISYRTVWVSTSLLGPTRSRLQRMPRVSTSQPGKKKTRHHLQGKTSTPTPSSTLN